MDLLQTVRKEGSRGGRGDFKWSDVQNSSHREHYLGHSLMAPVGRWAKGRDLNWYAKGDVQDVDDQQDPAAKAEQERKDEIRRVKEAEEDAMARAMGLPVPDRNNANLEPVSGKRDTALPGQEPEAAQGLGYERSRNDETGDKQDKELQNALKEYKRRHGDERHRRRRHRSRTRSRSRSRDRDRPHRRERERKRKRDRDYERDGTRDREPRNYASRRSPAKDDQYRPKEYQRRHAESRSRSRSRSNGPRERRTNQSSRRQRSRSRSPRRSRRYS